MPNELTAILEQAIAYYQQGDLAAAAATFDDVLRHAPDDPVALRLRGLTMRTLG